MKALSYLELQSLSFPDCIVAVLNDFIKIQAVLSKLSSAKPRGGCRGGEGREIGQTDGRKAETPGHSRPTLWMNVLYVS